MCKSTRIETLGEFIPSEEATERVILRDPEQLCFPIQADFGRDFFSEGTDLKVIVPEGIRELIAWRDSCTDRWGSDLYHSMMHWLGEEHGFQRDRVPEEHRQALDIFRKLPYEKQDRFIRACIPEFEDD